MGDNPLLDGVDFDKIAADRLKSFKTRAQGGVIFESGFEFEEYSRDLITQAEQQARKRNGHEPEVFSAADELAAVKYAMVEGYITRLEAQKKIRKLLRLPGKRAVVGRRITVRTTRARKP